MLLDILKNVSADPRDVSAIEISLVSHVADAKGGELYFLRLIGVLNGMLDPASKVRIAEWYDMQENLKGFTLCPVIEQPPATQS